MSEDLWLSGEWTGFFLESHHNRRGWMHLYLDFGNAGAGQSGRLHGEGTDYVGPWTLTGSFDTGDGSVQWVKRYVGRHSVRYTGQAGQHGIVGRWSISTLSSGPFQIWPRCWGELDEHYLSEEIRGSLPPGGRPEILAALDRRPAGGPGRTASLSAG